jgi:dienelactone hydrolase
MRAPVSFMVGLLGLGLGLGGSGLVRAHAQPPVLPGTQSLTETGDLSAQMVAGIDRMLMRELERSVSARAQYWRRDFSSVAAYEQSVAPNRERLRRCLGAVDPRLPVNELEWVGGTSTPYIVAETPQYRVLAVRWPVFEGVFGEGLLLEPAGKAFAAVVALPDADQTPEMLVGLMPGLPAESQFARLLAEQGCLVLVPVLIDRRDTWSGNEMLNRFTNQPHREWIYRQAFELGRHIIGYEVQKVLAAVDWLTGPASGQGRVQPRQGTTRVPVGLMGYGEGGLIALCAAALDTRIAVTVVSGYFDSRQQLWREPIYRNVFGLLREFGDAEIASLIFPRRLIIEHSPVLTIAGPPPVRSGRRGAAPGQWQTPEHNSIDAEVRRAEELVAGLGRAGWIDLINGAEGMPIGPGAERTLRQLLQGLGWTGSELRTGAAPTGGLPAGFDPDARQKRQLAELVAHTQRLLRQAEQVRAGFMPGRARSIDEWLSEQKPFKDILWNEVIGRFPSPTGPANARSRLSYDRPKWVGYDVVLDVWPDVFAWGVLLLPKNLQPGERRPVVVCQHGLEGLPADTLAEDPQAAGYRAYKAFAARLAERGFVVFAPHNPYRGGDAFRVLQRKANPLGRSLFSVILGQHERLLDWLSAQPFVDPTRIGFYGLSYGGKTAMRVPALLDRYCLSICSADFNEWILKNVTVDSGYSYMFTGEYEMPEWNLGHTFNYAEMAMLIAPRPFMVERGHDDGVAPDEWVAYEYAKVRRFYDRLGIGGRTEIEFFNGPHTIHGVGTFKFLHKHLNWPEPP